MKKVFPCWKVQYYDISTLCWRTIPKDYTSVKLAETVAKRLPVPKVRLMQIEGKDKTLILPEIKK
ncbi:MAG: hypothetical protein KKH91_04345 [Elusimicrobia bacterium]|nr:hypothetical protein [Elusimicrobiota bacterium]